MEEEKIVNGLYRPYRITAIAGAPTMRQWADLNARCVLTYEPCYLLQVLKLARVVNERLGVVLRDGLRDERKNRAVVWVDKYSGLVMLGRTAFEGYILRNLL